MRPRDILMMIQPQQVTCLCCGRGYFNKLRRGLCRSCSRRSRRLPMQNLRDSLRYGGEYIDFAGALYFYGDGERSQIHAVKFGGQSRLGGIMGRAMGALTDIDGLSGVEPTVVPVPLHLLRRLKRGYNQAEMLARGFCAASGLNIDTRILRRRRYTHRNARLSHDARVKNIRGAFAVGRNVNVNGGRFLLIDDVLTTGATVGEAARVLKQAGAAWVGVITYARAGGARAVKPDERRADQDNI